MTHPLPDDLIRKDVRDLPEYNAGLALDRFRDAYGIDCVAKLDSNESPLGPSPRAIEVMREAAKGVARYPMPPTPHCAAPLREAPGPRRTGSSSAMVRKI